MFQEKRPTCVTVIGWVWIILGGLGFFSGTMALVTSLTFPTVNHVGPEPSMQLPFIFNYFPFLAVGQMFLAILGFISGINFLKLKEWSRIVLEILTWLIILYIVGFGIFFVNHLMTLSTEGPAMGLGTTEIILMCIISFVVFCIYGVPLGIMIRYLRGQKVKSAMNGSAEPFV